MDEGVERSPQSPLGVQQHGVREKAMVGIVVRFADALPLGFRDCTQSSDASSSAYETGAVTVDSKILRFNSLISSA